MFVGTIEKCLFEIFLFDWGSVFKSKVDSVEYRHLCCAIRFQMPKLWLVRVERAVFSLLSFVMVYVTPREQDSSAALSADGGWREVFPTSHVSTNFTGDGVVASGGGFTSIAQTVRLTIPGNLKFEIVHQHSSLPESCLVKGQSYNSLLPHKIPSGERPRFDWKTPHAGVRKRDFVCAIFVEHVV